MGGRKESRGRRGKLKSRKEGRNESQERKIVKENSQGRKEARKGGAKEVIK